MSKTIEQLSPDAATLQKSRIFAALNRWSDLGSSGELVWGEVAGSSGKIYKTIIRVGEYPLLNCNCPSRKRPCKHSLGLYELHSKGDVPEKIEPPDWGEQWLKQQHRKSKPEASDTAQVNEKRLGEMQGGMRDLELWLQDIMERGLGSLDQDQCNEMASRMVDQRLSGIGRRLRSMGQMFSGGVDWPQKVLGSIGNLYLLCRAFAGYEKLEPVMQHHILQLGGLNVRKDSVLQGEAVKDRWTALGIVEGQEDQILFRKVFLLGKQSGRFGLLLDFAHQSMELPGSWDLGACFDGAVCYYPSAYPLRILIKENTPLHIPRVVPNGFMTWSALMEDYESVLETDPWLMAFPAILEEMHVKMLEDQLYLIDHEQNAFPAGCPNLDPWQLLASSAGNPIRVFGEWTGFQFNILTVFFDQYWLGGS